MPAVVRGSPTYSANVLGLVVAANATDVFTITGSDIRVVKIKRIIVTGIQTTGGQVLVVIAKRSTANTGAATTQTNVPWDSGGGAGTAAAAVVRSYTANPTTGTLVGRVMAKRGFIPAAASVVDQIPIEFDFELETGEPLVLRASTEVVAVNLNAVTVSGGALDVSVVWTEE